MLNLPVKKPVIGYHLEMKAFKVQILNPIAAAYLSNLAFCHCWNACNFLQGSFGMWGHSRNEASLYGGWADSGSERILHCKVNTKAALVFRGNLVFSEEAVIQFVEIKPHCVHAHCELFCSISKVKYQCFLEHQRCSSLIWDDLFSSRIVLDCWSLSKKTPACAVQR